jgi:glycosyltransferase involved in cell wall biosynthesis
VNGSDSSLEAGDDRHYRIAFVMPPWFDVPPQAYGGIELVVGNLIEALIDRGHDVVMIGAGKNGTRARFLRTYEVAPSERIGEPIPEVLQTVWSNRCLDDLEVDVIHDHSLAGPLTARGRKVPTVVTAHGPVTGEFGTYYRDLAQDVHLVVISEAQRRLAPGVRWATTVHNAVKSADFRCRASKDD